MREKIEIKTDSYSVSDTGQYDPSANSVVGTFYASVYKPSNDIQDLTMQQYTIEQTYNFKIRKPSFSITKDHFISWRGSDYGIIGVSNQMYADRFIVITARVI